MAPYQPRPHHYAVGWTVASLGLSHQLELYPDQPCPSRDLEKSCAVSSLPTQRFQVARLAASEHGNSSVFPPPPAASASRWMVRPAFPHRLRRFHHALVRSIGVAIVSRRTTGAMAARQKLRILCFGDSLTEGYSSSGLVFHPYHVKLQQMIEMAFPEIDIEIVEDGRSGDLVKYGFLSRMQDNC